MDLITLEKENPLAASAVKALAVDAVKDVEHHFGFSPEGKAEGDLKRKLALNALEELFEKLYDSQDKEHHYTDLTDAIAKDVVAPLLAEAVVWAVSLLNDVKTFQKST